MVKTTNTALPSTRTQSKGGERKNKEGNSRIIINEMRPEDAKELHVFEKLRGGGEG